MDYPKDDDEFTDHTIEFVTTEKDGTFAISCDGWHLWCGADLKIKPQAGQTARMYGRGKGAGVRGLFIDGEKVWYRTDAEQFEHAAILSYGKDAADWLARWDAGRSVWSVAMGGIGPGYEQCIQIVAAEVVRWLLSAKPERDSEWHGYDGAMSKAVQPRVNHLGLSGSQWAAGISLGAQIYFRGPRVALTDDAIKDRKIQVSKDFPSAEPSP